MKQDIKVKLYCQECDKFIRDIFIDPSQKTIPEIRVPVCSTCGEGRQRGTGCKC